MIKEKFVKYNWHVNNRCIKTFKKIALIKSDQKNYYTSENPIEKEDWGAGQANIMVIVTSSTKGK